MFFFISAHKSSDYLRQLFHVAVRAGGGCEQPLVADDGSARLQEGLDNINLDPRRGGRRGDQIAR